MFFLCGQVVCPPPRLLCGLFQLGIKISWAAKSDAATVCFLVLFAWSIRKQHGMFFKTWSTKNNHCIWGYPFLQTGPWRFQQQTMNMMNMGIPWQKRVILIRQLISWPSEAHVMLPRFDERPAMGPWWKFPEISHLGNHCVLITERPNVMFFPCVRPIGHWDGNESNINGLMVFLSVILLWTLCSFARICSKHVKIFMDNVCSEHVLALTMSK